MQQQRAPPTLINMARFSSSSSTKYVFLAAVVVAAAVRCGSSLVFEEITIDDIQRAFANRTLTSRQLVEYYQRQIGSLNPRLRAVIEVNPDALSQADAADRNRTGGGERRLGPLHGVPVLLKDNIATKDRLNTTAGSFALLGSAVPRDARVVEKLREAGAIILGKASLTQWSGFRSSRTPTGWSSRGGRGVNPYNQSADPCGSSSGPAIAAAANMAAVTLGTETSGSIICPAASNSVVGIKPTVGLTSRSGVIPISPRLDTVGPICRTVSDAVQVLDTIVGYDPRDSNATNATLAYIPAGGYTQFLKADGLRGKRLGLLKGSFNFPGQTVQNRTFQNHLNTMRQKGAVLINDVEIANLSTIVNENGLLVVLSADFKLAINAYLSELSQSAVKTLADIIAFNLRHAQEKINEYGQDLFLVANKTNGIGPNEQGVIDRWARLSAEGLEKSMNDSKLDAIVSPFDDTALLVLTIGGYPIVTVPAGYDNSRFPLGIIFGGLKGSEPKLIEIAYSFEQATRARNQPPRLLAQKINAAPAGASQLQFHSAV